MHVTGHEAIAKGAPRSLRIAVVSTGATFAIEPAGPAWAQVQPLSNSVWPPDLSPPPPWAHIVAQPPQQRVMVRNQSGELIAHVGIQIHSGLWDRRRVRIGGIGGVATRADERRKGLASRALDIALKELDAAAIHFALLFAESHNFAFYERRQWHKFSGDVFIEQPQGRI
ncbi:MAG: GNAT family N-acetyltransferase, partial [Alphaproteobacteria bacterium]